MKRSFSGPAEIVFQALDVVFAEVVPALDLDEDNVLRSGVGDAMRLPGTDVDRLAGPERDVAAVEGDHRVPRHHMPVLTPPPVTLVGKPFPGIDGNSLDLVIAAVGEYLEIAPGTVVFERVGFGSFLFHGPKYTRTSGGLLFGYTWERNQSEEDNIMSEAVIIFGKAT
jgi:hypothetical protein